MNELITMNTTTLLNKGLAKSINEINKAIATGNKSTWKVAEEFARITRDELFEDDFDNEKQFAEFVGVSKGYLSQCKTAVDFREKHNDLPITVSKAYILSTVEDFEEFVNWVEEEYNAKPWEFADKAIKDLIKEYKNKDAEPVEETTNEDVVDEVEDAMNIMVEVYDSEGTKYIVPMSVINQYRVEE